MNRKVLLILILILLGSLVGCQKEPAMAEVVKVIYTSSAGTILPELQWHEEISITPGQVSLLRRGGAETEVNVGNWVWAVEPASVETLFAQLGAVDCAALKRIDPEDAPDGGGAESYTLVYANGETCSLFYEAGVTYTQGERLVEPISQFVQNLQLPMEAASRYRFLES